MALRVIRESGSFCPPVCCPQHVASVPLEPGWLCIPGNHVRMAGRGYGSKGTVFIGNIAPCSDFCRYILLSRAVLQPPLVQWRPGVRALLWQPLQLRQEMLTCRRLWIAVPPASRGPPHVLAVPGPLHEGSTCHTEEEDSPLNEYRTEGSEPCRLRPAFWWDIAAVVCLLTQI